MWGATESYDDMIWYDVTTNCHQWSITRQVTLPWSKTVDHWVHFVLFNWFICCDIKQFSSERDLSNALSWWGSGSGSFWLFKWWCKTNYKSLFTPPTRTRQNCLVLSCPCQQCEQTITVVLSLFHDLWFATFWNRITLNFKFQILSESNTYSLGPSNCHKWFNCDLNQTTIWICPSLKT